MPLSPTPSERLRGVTPTLIRTQGVAWLLCRLDGRANKTLLAWNQWRAHSEQNVLLRRRLSQLCAWLLEWLWRGWERVR